MLSLRELRRAWRIAQEMIAGGTLRRIYQPDAYALVFVFDTAAGKTHLLLSCHPDHARISLAEPAEPAPSANSFYQYLRAHLAGSHLAGMKADDHDRQVRMLLQSREGSYTILLSILGTRSNLYLLDADGKLVHALRAPDETRKELRIGDPWTNPRSTVVSEGEDRWAQVPDAEYLAAIAKTYERLEQRHAAEMLARRLEQAVRKEKAFLDRKSINLQEDLGKARQAEKNRRQGELLKSVLHTVHSGESRIDAIDYETGESVEIPLDPTLSPAANLEAYFARYQKELRGEKIIVQQLEELESARQRLDAVSRQLQSALQADPPDMQTLETLAALPGFRRTLHRQAPRLKPVPMPAKTSIRKEIPSRLMPKRYQTQDGLEIWVGRNDAGNDYLTTRLARGNDLFFHLDGYPGSHVVLRTEGKLDPPAQAILDACELAVHFSKMKNAGSADVHMAHIKDVKKPKGAKPGLVYVRSGKSIRLRRDPRRLQAILAARLDE